jgi:hypothetical protein
VPLRERKEIQELLRSERVSPAGPAVSLAGRPSAKPPPSTVGPAGGRRTSRRAAA